MVRIINFNRIASVFFLSFSLFSCQSIRIAGDSASEGKVNIRQSVTLESKRLILGEKKKNLVIELQNKNCEVIIRCKTLVVRGNIKISATEAVTNSGIKIYYRKISRLKKGKIMDINMKDQSNYFILKDDCL
jgi:hypothetical protein